MLINIWCRLEPTMPFQSFSLKSWTNGGHECWVWTQANSSVPTCERKSLLQVSFYITKNSEWLHVLQILRDTCLSIYAKEKNTNCKKNTSNISRLHKMDSRAYSFNTLFMETFFFLPRLGEFSVVICSIFFKNKPKPNHSERLTCEEF